MSRFPLHMKSCGEAFAGSAHITGAAPHERPMKFAIGHAVLRQVDPAIVDVWRESVRWDSVRVMDGWVLPFGDNARESLV